MVTTTTSSSLLASSLGGESIIIIYLVFSNYFWLQIFLAILIYWKIQKLGPETISIDFSKNYPFSIWKNHCVVKQVDICRRPLILLLWIELTSTNWSLNRDERPTFSCRFPTFNRLPPDLLTFVNFGQFHRRYLSLLKLYAYLSLVLSPLPISLISFTLDGIFNGNTISRASIFTLVKMRTYKFSPTIY